MLKRHVRAGKKSARITAPLRAGQPCLRSQHVDRFVHIQREQARLGRRRQRGVDDDLSFRQDAVQMIRVAETLGVDLVNALRAGRPRRKPAALRDDFHSAEGRTVAGRLGENDPAAARTST